MKRFLQKCAARYINSYSLPGMAFLCWFILLPAWDFFQLTSAILHPPHQPKIFTLSGHGVGFLWSIGSFSLMAVLVGSATWHSWKEDWGRWIVHSFFFYLGIALSLVYIALNYYITGLCRISGI